MGSDRSKDSSTYENELPQHSVTIDNGFWIDKYPVTNIEYDYFVNHNGYHKKDYWTAEGWTWAQSHLGKFKTSNLVIYNKIKHPYLPRIGVTWFEAVAYAKWRDARLPNEAEWEYAARGKDGRIYPHGDVFDANKVVFRDNSEGKPAPVGSKPDGLTWVGALDMIGNVWEWTTTIYDRVRFPYPFAEDGRDNLQGNQVRVLRGGSYSSPPSRLRIAFRYAISSSGAEDINGFRCVRDTLP
jgi:formylglycine-generating enzyme required for sulfatase activity